MKSVFIIGSLLLALAIALPVTGCRTIVRPVPVHAFQSYHFNQETSLISRVSIAPDFLMTYLKELDKKADYQPYSPSVKEMKIIETSLGSLPPAFRRILKKRLVGIYFVKNFLGNGMTDWIIDSHGDVYVVLVFNASVFAKNISRLLTDKENTCFIPNDPDYRVSIDCGTSYNGFLYILLHEATHAVDYIKSITPYTDVQYKKHLNRSGAGTAFTRNIWTGYDRPRERFLFTGKVYFYGFHEPLLRISDAPDIYRDLVRSPFVTLYGSLSWAEDLSELTSFYHITRVMQQPFTINVTYKDKIIRSIRPMDSQKVKERLGQLSMFYK
jgi:hypothetical protein